MVKRNRILKSVSCRLTWFKILLMKLKAKYRLLNYNYVGKAHYTPILSIFSSMSEVNLLIHD
uniref:Uncharacterized protein n=1 Tax=uncultured marine virus TaxID=186617 RepID=A0A0F7L0I9_9VIRU|nr:hypothetical protein [uncultured marine virus]